MIDKYIQYNLYRESKKKNGTGVPAVVQWVKNLTAAAQVVVEMQVQSPAWCLGLKDLLLL